MLELSSEILDWRELTQPDKDVAISKTTRVPMWLLIPR